MATDAPVSKEYKGLAMEGSIARRYAKLRRTTTQLDGWRTQARQLTAELPDGARLLEVAPGPGYFAIELARLGRFHVTGLDISRTFVELAQESARQAGVAVDFRLGDVGHMGFPDASFDFIVCQAAFKNFSEPGRAIAEMYRVLRPGGIALIQDLRGDASDVAIRAEVDTMRLGFFGAFMTRRILGGLRRRAYTKDQFEGLAAASPFGTAQVRTTDVEVDVRLQKPAQVDGR